MLIRSFVIDSFVTDTQALIKFMMGKRVINNRSHKAFQNADKGLTVIMIPAIVLMEVLYLFEKNRIDISLLQTETEVLDRLSLYRIKVNSGGLAVKAHSPGGFEQAALAR